MRWDDWTALFFTSSICGNMSSTSSVCGNLSIVTASALHQQTWIYQHLYLAFQFHRDYFARPDASLSGSFVPQGLFRPAGCISIGLFCSTGITLPRSDASLSDSFAPQGLFRPAECISVWLFCAAGIISTARMHPITGRPSLKTSLPGHSINFRFKQFSTYLIHCLKSWHLIRGYNLTHILRRICFHIRKPSFFKSLASNPNFQKSPESMFFNLSYATPDALRNQSFLRLSAAFAAYSPSHNGAFVSKLPQHLMLGLCVAHC